MNTRSTQLIAVMFASMVIFLASANNATAISYNESWAIDGDLSDNYPHATVVFADLDSVSSGVVSLSDNGGLALVTISASTVTGGASSTFDVSTNPLTLTLKDTNSTGKAGQAQVAMFIGSTGAGRDFLWHPAYGPPSYRHADHGTNGSLTNLPNDNGADGPQDMTLSVIENGANYDFTFTVGAITNTASFSIASIGTFNSVGLRADSVGGNSTATFGKLSVNQTPEPATFVLGVLGMLSLGGFAWRRRVWSLEFRV